MELKNNKKRNLLITSSIIVGIILILGLIVTLNLKGEKNTNDEKKINTSKNESKKLGIEVIDINLEEYPYINVKIQSDKKNFTIDEESINFYENDEQIDDFNVIDNDTYSTITYKTNDNFLESADKMLKIENKKNKKDYITETYIKPKQTSANLNISQIDTNNFPEVKMYFTINEQGGNIVKNIDKKNIRLYDGEKEYNINDFSYVNEKEPVSLNMVIDTSGSMSSNMEVCKDIAIDFINNINFNMGDRVEVVKFNDEAKINNYFTSNKESLINSITDLSTDGGTALYDSLIMALNETNKEDGVKCIIAFTDGIDNRSQNTSEDVIELSKTLDIPIYIIGIGSEIEKSKLEEISINTAGEYISISDVYQLKNVYTNILKKTREQYMVTYDIEEDNENISNTINIDLNSYGYIGDVSYEFNIKPAEYRINSKKYEQLKEDIKKQATNQFDNIQGKYSLAFRDLSKGSTLSIGSEKTISASTIKIFIMIECFYAINNGELNQNQRILVTDDMKVGGSGILIKEESEKKYTISELIDLMMIKSDNTAANILIDKLGMDNINSRIRALGCVDTELNRKMMDQEAINKGIQNYTSVDDLALVLTKLYNGQCVSDKYDSMMLDIMKQNETKSKIPNELPDNVSVANKSGEFAGVENDAGIIFTDKGAYILCIVTEEGNSNEQVTNISSISKYIYEKYIE